MEGKEPWLDERAGALACTSSSPTRKPGPSASEAGGRAGALIISTSTKGVQRAAAANCPTRVRPGICLSAALPVNW